MRLCLNCRAAFDAATWECPACTWSPAAGEFPLFAPALAETDEHFPRGSIEPLAQLESEYFWAPARNELIHWMVAKYFPDATSLLEVGCGPGAVLAHLRSKNGGLALTGADALPEALRVARARIPNAEFLQADARAIPYQEEFDVVCALDVIEHIDEDNVVLEAIAGALRSRGGVVISVPQHAWLWSAWDEFHRHRRRYSRSSLLHLLDQAGFEPVRVTSSVMFLLPLAAASRMRNREVTDRYDAYAELRIPPFVNRMFGSVMRLERSLIRRGVSLPVGTSLLVAARKRPV